MLLYGDPGHNVILVLILLGSLSYGLPFSLVQKPSEGGTVSLMHPFTPQPVKMSAGT